MPFSPLLWDAQYETQVAEIDLQHQYFLHLINRLASELLTSKDDKYRSRLLDELCRYAAFHFVSEENLMLKFNYPDLEAHRKLHLSLLDRLSSHSIKDSVEELLDFLVDWFVQHTIHEDHRIGEFLQSQGLTGPQQN
jgi:hemerythrin